MLSADPELEALRMVIDRRDELTRQRIQTVNRLHRLLGELLPETAKRDILALKTAGEYRHHPSRLQCVDGLRSRCLVAREYWEVRPSVGGARGVGSVAWNVKLADSPSVR